MFDYEYKSLWGYEYGKSKIERGYKIDKKTIYRVKKAINPRKRKRNKARIVDWPNQSFCWFKKNQRKGKKRAFFNN